MRMIENYNNAKQKYSKDIFEKVTNAHIPDRYIDAACRFLRDNNNLSIGHLKELLSLWHRYVWLTDKIDINDVKNYSDFFQKIHKGIILYKIPNQIYNDGDVIIGLIDSLKTIRKFDEKNPWCIKQEHRFPKYQYLYNLYLIDVISQGKNNYYVLIIDKKVYYGRKIYWNISNKRCTDDEVENSMTPEAIIFINDKLVNLAKERKSDKFENYPHEVGIMKIG